MLNVNSNMSSHVTSREAANTYTGAVRQYHITSCLRSLFVRPYACGGKGVLAVFTPYHI